MLIEEFIRIIIMEPHVVTRRPFKNRAKKVMKIAE